MPPSRTLTVSSALLSLAVCAAIDTVSITLNDTAITRPIAPNFASFSYEISGVLSMIGRFPAPPNPTFVRLMNILREVNGAAGPQLRIGGNSAETSVYWPGSEPLPPNQTYAIKPADLQSYAAALPLWNGSAVIDTSMFVQDNATWAVAHVAAVSEYLGWDRVDGIEVGNEPEIFHDSGVRPHAWSFADYSAEFAGHVAALHAGAGLPFRRIQGAVFCCNNSDYDAGFANYTSTFAARGELASVSYHRYALGGCEGKVTTLPELLSDAASVGIRTFLEPYGAAAAAAGVPLVVGEGNSVSCGGRDGVSNVFGTALWAVDALFNAAAAGARRWNFHGGPQGAYTPIAFPNASSTVPDVRPLYYAMLAFTQATAGGGFVTASSVSASNDLVKAWTVLAPASSGGARRVIVIHKDPGAAAAARVTVRPGAMGASAGAVLTRLVVAAGGNVSSTHGVSLGGLTWDGSTDGAPLGTPISEPVPFTSGAWSFSVPPGSAAILAIPGAGGSR